MGALVGLGRVKTLGRSIAIEQVSHSRPFEVRPYGRGRRSSTRRTVSLSHEPRYVPGYNAVLIANRVHFG
jgi:hypothetical protein